MFPLKKLLQKKKKEPPKEVSKTLFDKLVLNPEQFSFIKAVDVSAKVCGERFVELKSNINFSSKFNDISKIEGLKDGIAEIYTNLYGISGINGSLPDFYVEEFITFNRESKKAVIDFFDIFNDRILKLHYSYSKKQDVSALSVPIEKSYIGNILFSLSGISAKTSENIKNASIPEQFKISAQNLFWRYTRSASGLETLLASFFKVPIEVRQFSGDFIKIEKEEQTAIGNLRGRFNSLGNGSILGNKVWDQTSGIEVIIGPLGFSDYAKFLPKQSHKDQKFSALQKMKEIVRSYVPHGISVKLCFQLDACEVQETYLNGVNRLNKNSFICGRHRKEAYFIEKV